jgi:hypothetical protein
VLVDSLGTPAVDVPTVPAEAVAYALEHRSDVQAERERTDAVTQGRRAVGYENLPSLGFSGLWQTSGQERRLDYLIGSIRDRCRSSAGSAASRYANSRPARRTQVRQRDRAAGRAETRQSLLDLASA